MLKFHRRVNPKEGLIGMYISGSKIDSQTALLYQYYQTISKDLKNKSPLAGQQLILLIDPTMQDNQLSIKVSKVNKC